MKVLVTGGAGFIGKAVVNQLTATGHEPSVFDYRNGFNLSDMDDVHWQVDQVEAVINLAGVLGTEEMIGAEANAVEVNIAGAVNVYDAAAKAGVPVVQIGTGHRGQLNPYAITKACAEDLGLARARWRGEKITVVRAFHAYGPGQKAFPPHGKATVRKIMPSFICRALTGMPLIINGDGDQLIDLVHVDDVAKTLVDAIGGPWGEVVEAGTGVATTVKETATIVRRACRSESVLLHVEMRDGEPEHAVVVASNPACLNPFPYGLEATIDFYRALVAA